MTRVVAWFSCGATSAVSTKIALSKYPDAKVVYCDTHSEHTDNERFLRECEVWFGNKIEIIQSDKYRDIWDVFEKTSYIAGVGGARCTTELKKKVRRLYTTTDDLQVWGFDSQEQERAIRFEGNNPEVNSWFPLIENNISKHDCLDALHKAGIELPMMYKMGYGHNNCIGCPKGGAGYWNKIRIDFPDIFERMRKQEEALNAHIVQQKGKHISLSELDPQAGRSDDFKWECDLFCMSE